MSHFYGSIPTSARKTVATARGHASTGLTTRAASWQGAIEVELWHNTETGKDEYVVWQRAHHGHGVNEILVKGVIGERVNVIKE
tara:strand:- start:4683 stop:4934 length:252 start_codon:yes stop_codon:yes gene_type:complete